MWEAHPVGGHAIVAIHNAEGDRVVVGALVTHHAHAADGEEDGEGLPDFVIPARGFHFLEHDGVGLADDAQALSGDLANHADGEARAWERLAVDDFLRESEFGADFADFVFEKLAEWFDEFEFHLLGEAADIVVALDECGGVAGDGNALDHIGVERALGEEAVVAGIGFFQIARGFFEDLDELVADDLALALGVGDAFEFFQKLLGGIHCFHPDAELSGEKFFHRRRFVGAEESVVYKDAGEAVANGFVEQDGGDGGIHAAAEAEDHAAFADLLADFAAGAVDERFHRPVRCAAADAVDEVGDDFLAAWRVDDLGVELQPVDVALGVADDGVGGVFGFSERAEAGGELGDFVAVAVPDFQLGGELVEEGALWVALELAGAVFAGGGTLDLATETVGDELHAIANAENRDAEVVDFFVHLRSLRRINAGRAARENDAGRAEFFDLRGFGAEGEDFGVDATLANAAGNDLGVLGTEIENEDFFLSGL